MIEILGKNARKAARLLRAESSFKKNQALLNTVFELNKRQAEIFKANEEDLKEAENKNLSASMLDRLRIDE